MLFIDVSHGNLCIGNKGTIVFTRACQQLEYAQGSITTTWSDFLGALKDLIVSTPQVEDSGSRTAARYRYQALFGLALVLERHVLDGDYAIVFEFHDDIAVFDDSAEPNAVRFYQVKTKASGEFGSADIVRQPATKKGEASPVGRSILGKMYRNVVEFSDNIEGTVLVSNAGAKFSKGKANVCFSECDEGDLRKIVARLEEDFPENLPIQTDLLHFRRADLSLEDADVHAKGKLDSFVVSQLGAVEFSSSALFDAVSSECSQKARASSALESFEAAVRDRGVTREDTNKWLAAVGEVKQCPTWEELAPQLTLPARQNAAVRRNYMSYRIEVLNPNDAVRRVRREISRELMDEKYEDSMLTEVANEVSSAVSTYAQKQMAHISIEKLKAMVIYETFANQQT
jgi:hypothetical protein